MNRVKIVNASGETLYLHLWQHIQERSISQEINMQEYEMSAGGVITSEPRLKSRRLKLGGSWFEQGVNSELSSTAIQAKLLDGPLKLYQDEDDIIYWDNVILANSSNVPNFYKVENQMGFEFILLEPLRRGVQKTEEWIEPESAYSSYPAHYINNEGQFDILPDLIQFEIVGSSGKMTNPSMRHWKSGAAWTNWGIIMGTYTDADILTIELEKMGARLNGNLIVSSLSDSTLITPFTIYSGNKYYYFRQNAVDGDVKITVKYTERYI